MRARAAVAGVHRARVAVVARHGGMRARAVVAGIDRAGVGVVALRVRGAHQRGGGEGVEAAGAGPGELYGSTSSRPGSLTSIAPTAITSGSAAWAITLPSVTYCCCTPSRQNISSVRSAPETFSIATFATCADPEVLTTPA